MKKDERLPRYVLPNPTSVFVGICEINRDTNGRLSVKEIKGFERLTGVRSTEFFQTLDPPTPGKFLSASFDTRLGRDLLLKVADECMNPRFQWLNL